MDKIQEIESIASRYDLDVDFVQQLHDKVTDKENFARAVKMFVDGTLPFALQPGMRQSMLHLSGMMSP